MITSYDTLPDTSRVWIYQSNRPFTTEEAADLQNFIDKFVAQWTTHNEPLTAYGELLHQQFVVLMVDESNLGASGCSIDSSVHFIKAIEKQYGVNMFDRMNFTYKQGDQIKTAPRAILEELYQKGEINDDTLVFDNLVKNKGEFEARWIVPLKDSWHKQMV